MKTLVLGLQRCGPQSHVCEKKREQIEVRVLGTGLWHSVERGWGLMCRATLVALVATSPRDQLYQNNIM